MILFRFHRGGLFEAMSTLKKFDTFNDFISFIFNNSDTDSICLESYSDSSDKRINWNFTGAVSIHTGKYGYIYEGWFCDNDCFDILDFFNHYDIVPLKKDNKFVYYIERSLFNLFAK